MAFARRHPGRRSRAAGGGLADPGSRVPGSSSCSSRRAGRNSGSDRCVINPEKPLAD